MKYELLLKLQIFHPLSFVCANTSTPSCFNSSSFFILFLFFSSFIFPIFFIPEKTSQTKLGDKEPNRNFTI